MQRVGPKAKYRISNNLIAFMVDGTPLTRESRTFIYTWVRQPDGNGRSKSFCDVWDLVLQNYSQKQRHGFVINRGVYPFIGFILVFVLADWRGTQLKGVC